MKQRGHKLSGFLKILLTVLLIFLVYWVELPPMNPRSPQFWTFLVFVGAICLIVNFFSAIRDFFYTLPRSDLRTAGAGFKGLGKPVKFFLGFLAFVVVLLMFGNLIGAPFFHASRYKSLISVETGDFTQDVAEIKMSQIPVVDRDTASRLGRRKLGEMSDLVSQFEIEEDFTQINYQGTPYRVTPLIYGDPVKWLYNRSQGLPAYITVNMVTQETTLVRMESGIKYSRGEYFFRNIYRHLRFHYPTKIFDEISFEIDEEGTPYWVAPTIRYRIGLWSGKDIGGAVLVNAVTGECVYYDVKDIPSWVDQVYLSDLVVEQMNYYGKFQNGFINSVIGQRGVLQTTAGYNYLAIGDDVWLYTGMTSVMSDESNTGFILANLRTKETKYYVVPGAEEFSAMESAQGQVQHLNYVSTFPLLLNVSNRPTYFMSLKDAAGLVKMYAFVDVEQYQVVGTGVTVDEARADYASKFTGEDIEIQPEESGEIQGKIAAISSAVVDGNTVYYFMLEDSDMVYTAGISVSQHLPFYKAGDQVKVGYTELEGVRQVIRVE